MEIASPGLCGPSGVARGSRVGSILTPVGIGGIDCLRYNGRVARLGERKIRDLLAPFQIELTSRQVAQVATYLELLLRWNARINLTGVRTAEECVGRHFGESLYLAHMVELQGANLDIGSGAGFPGLALKIAAPDLATTLLEPVGKKRAFLHEVVRACGVEGVEVRPERLEEFLRRREALALDRDDSPSRFDSATARAVGGVTDLAKLAATALRPGGKLCLWLGRDQARDVARGVRALDWGTPLPVPLARQREILVGVRHG
jgi:16S rRNA (guanine527-N7)-methyltransferase